MNKYTKILIFLFIILFIINYPILDKALINFLEDSESVFITEIVDGDTAKTNETAIRLLGINSPEKGEEYYEEAKQFLKSKILNEKVELKFTSEKTDLYGRTLAYIISEDKNINFQLVENGFANCYFYDKDNYHKECQKIWKTCINSNKNLCEKSYDKCSGCIILESFDYKNEELIFRNICNFDCNLAKWTIKDEGRKKFVFPEFILKQNYKLTIKISEGKDSDSILFWRKQDYVWTDSGDTLFLRDSKNKLVLWENY